MTIVEVDLAKSADVIFFLFKGSYRQLSPVICDKEKGSFEHAAIDLTHLYIFTTVCAHTFITVWGGISFLWEGAILFVIQPTGKFSF